MEWGLVSDSVSRRYRYIKALDAGFPPRYNRGGLVPPPPGFKRGENGAGTPPIFLGGFGGWNAPIPGGVWGLVRQGNPWGGARGGILAAVVAAWPGLPEAIRAGILALVRTSVGED